MAEYNDKKNIFYHNLIDAGCKKQSIGEYIMLYENNENKRLIKQLSIHRMSLLQDLHHIQNEIDCLDYLLYRLENEEFEEEKL